jgi:hypothetical protein
LQFLLVSSLLNLLAQLREISIIIYSEQKL